MAHRRYVQWKIIGNIETGFVEVLRTEGVVAPVVVATCAHRDAAYRAFDADREAVLSDPHAIEVRPVEYEVC